MAVLRSQLKEKLISNPLSFHALFKSLFLCVEQVLFISDKSNQQASYVGDIRQNSW